jgi:hypothetical protein
MLKDKIKSNRKQDGETRNKDTENPLKMSNMHISGGAKRT